MSWLAIRGAAVVYFVPHEMIPTADILQRANQILQEMEALQAELDGLFGGTDTPAPKRRGRPPGAGNASSVVSGMAGKRRGPRAMSSEARAKIAEAQKARWAKVRAEKQKKMSKS